MKNWSYAGIYHTGYKKYVKGRAAVASNAMSGPVKGDFNALIGEVIKYRGE